MKSESAKRKEAMKGIYEDDYERYMENRPGEYEWQVKTRIKYDKKLQEKQQEIDLKEKEKMAPDILERTRKRIEKMKRFKDEGKPYKKGPGSYRDWLA